MEELRPIFSVHELNEYVDLMLGHDPNLSRLTVEGELSGCKRHPNGHLYFTLKDDLASVSCVMWKQHTQALRFLPRDGMRVRLIGSAALYARDGRFQLYATALQKQGEGDLFAAFCKYRDELQARGWFDAESKQPIPQLPACVGVVTSGAGAALHDIKTVIARRFPSMPIRLYPAAVQGEGAADEIARAIEAANAEAIADVLIVGRGGGSMEDLWAFNEPPVAEAIHKSRIPVISAVGHETDVSISDFVADLRAPTPSAAAELAVPEKAALEAGICELGRRLSLTLLNGVAAKRDRLRLLWADGTKMRLRMRMDRVRQSLADASDTMDRMAKDATGQKRNELVRMGERMEAYSPQRTLMRGFALIYDSSEKLITSAGALTAGRTVRMRLHDGAAEAVVSGKDTE